MISKQRLTSLLFFLIAGFVLSANAQDKQPEYQLGSGDNIRIVVFQNPDLTVETRVTENGTISYPLVGTVKIGGMTIPAAEQAIAKALKDGNFIQQPQVNIALLQNRGNQVSVLGMVNRPGRFPLETFNTRVSEMIAIAGGIAATGADIAILTGLREGKPFRREIDIPGMFLDNKLQSDVVVAGGDVIYVYQQPMYYIYGEVQKAGSYRIGRGMTIRQALAEGGGPSLADIAIVTGLRDGKPFRREIDIPAMFLDNKLQDDVAVAGGDVIYVYRQPMYYIYGEVQKAGSYRIERGMTVRQALAQGGGPTLRGTERRLRLYRRGADGKVETLSPDLNDTVQINDVLYVNESLF